MEFTSVILFLTLYFIRPQDWVPGLAGMNVAKPTMLLGIVGLLMRNRKSILNAPYPFRATPHEWIMAIYLGYIVFTSPDPLHSVAYLVPKATGFFLTLHSLTSLDRAERFLRWWRWSLAAVAFMGVCTLIGFDFTGSQPMTDAGKGRLAINTWMLDNANAVGHTLVTLLPLLYFGLVKGRPMSKSLMALPPAAMACWCLWSTQSKGAYVVGAALLVFSVMLGRPWWLKISVLALAIGMGGTLLSALPRMSEMSHLKSDEGVTGRLMAWEIARNVTRTTVTGEGFMGFHANIRWEGKVVSKATHSAYVQVGGDLGIPGLLLYLSTLCCGLRTMITYYGVSKELDRVRGALFSLLLAYMASGWMINRSYHLEFFLIIGAIAAYQRLCVRAVTSAAAAAVPAPSLVAKPVGAWLRKRVAANKPSSPNLQLLAARLKKWQRYGLLDLGLALVSLELVLDTWDYVLTSL